MKQIREREWWIILILLGVVILNFPLIIIFNTAGTLFGLPVFFLYLNIGWLLSILTIYLYTKTLDEK